MKQFLGKLLRAGGLAKREHADGRLQPRGQFGCVPEKLTRVVKIRGRDDADALPEGGTGLTPERRVVGGLL